MVARQLSLPYLVATAKKLGRGAYAGYAVGKLEIRAAPGTSVERLIEAFESAVPTHHPFKPEDVKRVETQLRTHFKFGAVQLVEKEAKKRG